MAKAGHARHVSPATARAKWPLARRHGNPRNFPPGRISTGWNRGFHLPAVLSGSRRIAGGL